MLLLLFCFLLVGFFLFFCCCFLLLLFCFVVVVFCFLFFLGGRRGREAKEITDTQKSCLSSFSKAVTSVSEDHGDYCSSLQSGMARGARCWHFITSNAKYPLAAETPKLGILHKSCKLFIKTSAYSALFCRSSCVWKVEGEGRAEGAGEGTDWSTEGLRSPVLQLWWSRMHDVTVEPCKSSSSSMFSGHFLHT